MGKLHEKSVRAHYSTYFVEYNAMRGKFSAGYSVTEDHDTPKLHRAVYYCMYLVIDVFDAHI
jgi:hypothetical protein